MDSYNNLTGSNASAFNISGSTFGYDSLGLKLENVRTPSKISEGSYLSVSQGPEACSGQIPSQLSTSINTTGASKGRDDFMSSPQIISDKDWTSLPDEMKKKYYEECNLLANNLLKDALLSYYKGEKAKAIEKLEESKPIVFKLDARKYYWMLKQASIYFALGEEQQYKQIVQRVASNLGNVEENSDTVDSKVILLLMQARDLIEQDKLQEAAQLLENYDKVIKHNELKIATGNYLDFYEEYRGKLFLKETKIKAANANHKEISEMLQKVDECYEAAFDRRMKIQSNCLLCLSYNNRYQLYVEWDRLLSDKNCKQIAKKCLKSAVEAKNSFMSADIQDEKKLEIGIVDYTLPNLDKSLVESQSL